MARYDVSPENAPILSKFQFEKRVYKAFQALVFISQFPSTIRVERGPENPLRRIEDITLCREIGT